MCVYPACKFLLYNISTMAVERKTCKHSTTIYRSKYSEKNVFITIKPIFEASGQTINTMKTVKYCRKILTFCL